MSAIRSALIAITLTGLGASQSWAQPTSDVEVVDAKPLTALDLFSAGARTTGLPTNLWKGASAGLARRVLTELAVQPIEPGLAQLARDALETAAAAPDGAGSDGDLAGDRVLSLIRLGDLDAARAILSRTPGVAARSRLSQASADLALWTGELDKACSVSESLSDGRDAPYWLQLRAFCLTRSGKLDQAQLALDFAAQAGARNVRLAHMLMQAQGGKVAVEDPAQATTALDFAISRSGKQDFRTAVASATVPALMTLSADETVPADIRRKAAFRLLSSGASAAEAVRSALRAPVPAPKPSPPVGRRKIQHAVSTVEDDVPDTVARDYQTATSAATNAERAGALIRLLRSARGAMFRNLCDVTAPELALVTPDGLGGADRALLALATAVVDAPSAAALREGLAPVDGVSVVDLQLIDSVREMAAITPKASKTAEALVTSGLETNGTEQTKAQTGALLLASVDGRFNGLPPAARTAFATFRTGPAIKAGAALTALISADSGAAGEAALATLDAASEKGLLPSDRALFIRALSRAGLERQARSIALDGLLALAGH